MAERPSISLDAGHLVAVRVAVEHGKGFRKSIELFERNEPAVRQGRVECDRRVAFAQDEAVADGVVGTVGIDVQDGEVEGNQDIGGRHLPANVPQTGTVHRLQVPPPYRACQLAQLLDLLSICLDGFYHREASPAPTPVPAPMSMSNTSRCASSASCRPC